MQQYKKKKQFSKTVFRETVSGLLFIAPSLLGFIFLSLMPLIMTIILSLSKWDLVSGIQGIQIIGFDNYSDLFRDNTFYLSLKNNILFAILSMPVLIILGFLGAVLINNLRRGASLFKVLYFLPYISSTIAVASVWRVIFQPSYGPINQFLLSIGIENPPGWLASPDWALLVISLMYIWQQIGYFILIYINALASVPEELYEAARIDGASRFHILRNITIPMVSPSTFFLSVTGLISSFKIFDAIQVMTQGGPGNSTSVLVYYLYKVSFQYYKFGYGASISMILFVIVLLITVIQWQGQRQWVNY